MFYSSYDMFNINHKLIINMHWLVKQEDPV